MEGKRPTVASVHGVVAAAHPLAAQAGAKLLAQGGNAFDAAAATTAALNVVEPYMSGLAGMGMATCYIAAEKRIRTLDFITLVPEKFPVGRFKQREEIYRGPLAAGTPGSLAGWCELVKTRGRKTLAEVFAPAIALARDGYPIIELNTWATNEAASSLKDFSFFDTWNRNYTGGTGAVAKGYVLKQPDLARTYEAIVSEGPRHLYGGELGRKLIAHIQSLGGCMTMADLEGVKPTWLDPLSARYRDLQVHSLPPHCEAFQYFLTLRILDGFDLGKLERDGVEHLDIVWRAIRLAAGERIAHNQPNPEKLANIMSDANVEALRARIKDKKPVDGLTEQWLPKKHDPNKEHTTSLSIADREGNAICLTQSLGGGFGCGVVIPGTGVCLNNFLYWGEVDPRGTNPLLPGAVLALPTAPSIATRADGKPVLVLGTPGSYGICQTQAQALVQHVDFKLGLQDAIEAPRARLWDGRRVEVENRIAAPTLAALKARGHDIESNVGWTMHVGGMQGVAIDPDSGAMNGAADPRRDSYVATP